jgi:hypothetical protein
LEHPDILNQWQENVRPLLGELRSNAPGTVAFLGMIALVTFPPMAIGLSGFELALVSAPLVRGWESDTREAPRGRIIHARAMMITAGLLMSVLVLASVSAVGLLVPYEAIVDESGVVHHRAIAHLAHGGLMVGGHAASEEIAPFFGTVFGTVYDLSTILILCLAGAAATVTLKDVVPGLMGKFGMQLAWTRRMGLIAHLFNMLILLVTIVFKAKVDDLMWAYAASVLAVLLGAAFGAATDLRERARGWGLGWASWLVALPFSLAGLVFLLMLGMVAVQGPAGFIVAGLFVTLVLVTGIVVRWWRGSDTTFESFEFANPESEERFRRAVGHSYQVLIPRPVSRRPARDIEAQARERAGLSADVPVIVLEVEMGDRGDLRGDTALLTMLEKNGRETIQVRGSRSLPHTIAAVALACREVGQPPDVHFGQRYGSWLDGVMNFLLLGQADLPAAVREILERAEPDPARRPRVYEV